MFGTKPTQDSVFNSTERPIGLMLSPIIAVIVIGLVCGCMVGAYLLGFKAGHTNGLELALANSVSQVVRSPIARSDNLPQDAASDADVYAKLREPAAIKDSGLSKPQDVSKEVKEFLQPTPTVSLKDAASLKQGLDKANSKGLSENDVQGEGSIEVASLPQTQKKNADMAAIERALNDAKQGDSAVATKEDSSVRVIGKSASSANEKRLEVASADLELAEDFSEPDVLKKDSSSSKKNSLVQEKAPKQENKKAQSAALVADKKTETKDIKLKSEKKELERPTQVVAGSTLSSGWYSQVAAPRSITEAQNITAKLKSAGFRAKIETAQVRDEKYFRVVVGPEANRQAADQVLTQLKKQSAVKTEPFIRMVR